MSGWYTRVYIFIETLLKINPVLAGTSLGLSANLPAQPAVGLAHFVKEPAGREPAAGGVLVKQLDNLIKLLRVRWHRGNGNTIAIHAAVGRDEQRNTRHFVFHGGESGNNSSQPPLARELGMLSLDDDGLLADQAKPANSIYVYIQSL